VRFQNTINTPWLTGDDSVRDVTRHQFLSQRLQITGLGTPTFQSYVDKLLQIHSLFQRHVPEGSLMSFPQPSLEGYPCADFSTRYFTSRRDEPMGEATPFSKTVDPKGVLLSMMGDDLFHGVENQVLYYSIRKDGDGDTPR
jgi:hypothetical protein